MADQVYLSTNVSGKAIGPNNTILFADEDIISFDTDTQVWSVCFDGSDLGLNVARADLDAFHLLDNDCSDGSEILMSFNKRKLDLTGLGTAGIVNRSDLVKFTSTTLGENTSGSFALEFDGSNFGLNRRREDIDAVTMTGTGELVISTRGRFNVPAVGGGVLKGRPNDLIKFDGVDSWSMYLDGSDIGLTHVGENIWGAWIDPNSDDIYLASRGRFSFGGVKGNGQDIFICKAATVGVDSACTSVSLYFDGSKDPGLLKPRFIASPRIDGLSIVNNIPPAAQNDDFSIDEDPASLLQGNVLNDNGNGTDTDPDGGILSISTTPAVSPAHGMLNLFENGDFDYTPDADYNGEDSFKYTLMDDAGGKTTGLVTISIKPVNDEPDFAAVNPPASNEDAGAQTVNSWAVFDAGPVDEEGAQSVLAYMVSNVSNGALFSVPPAVDNNGVLTYTATANANGSSTFDVQVQDNGGTADGGDDTSMTQQFTITVNAVNDEPNFTASNPPASTENGGAQTVNNWAVFDAGPADEDSAPQAVIAYTVSNISNSGLFSAAPVVDSNGNLTYTAAADTTGSSTFDVQVQDDGGTANGGDDTSQIQTFTITISPKNLEPGFTASDPAASLEDSGLQTVSNWAVFDAGSPAENLTQSVLVYSVSNIGNPSLFAAAPAVDVGGNLTYTAATNANGSSTFDVQVQDDGGTAGGGDDTSQIQTFTITVTAVNDEPSFTGGSNPTVNEDSGMQNVMGWATAISSGPANEAGQTLTFNIASNSNSGLFSAGPAVNASGDLSFTPAANASGSAMIGLELMDNGGTANGGDDTSAVYNFTITVNPLNDAPQISGIPIPFQYDVIGNVQISVPAASGLLDSVVITDPDGAGTTPFFIGGTVPTASVNGGNVSITPATGAFTYNPPAGFEGSDSFDYQICDNGIPLPSACSTPVTVTLNVAELIWFVDASASAGGDGRLTAPFNCLTGAGCFDAAADETGDIIFVADGNYTGGLTLLSGQKIIGDGSSSTLATLIPVTVPTHSVALPVFSGTDPVLTSSSNGINLASGNTVRGLTIGNTTGTGISGGAVGTATVSETTVNGTGAGVSITGSGVLAMSFDQISSSNATGIQLNNVTGNFNVSAGTINSGINTAVNIVGAGGKVNLGVTLTSVSSSGGSTQGIIITNTTGSFTVSGDGSAANNGSGGTIATKTGNTNAVTLTDAANISLNRMNIGAAGGLSNITGNGIRATRVNGFTLNRCNLRNIADANSPDEAALFATNPQGVWNITDSLLDRSWDDHIRIENTTTTSGLSINLTGNTLSNNDDSNFGNDSFLYIGTDGNTNATMTIQGNIFDDSDGDHIQVALNGTASANVTIGGPLVADGNTMTATLGTVLGSGITLSSGSGSGGGFSGTLTYLIRNNDIQNASAAAINVNMSSTSTAGALYTGMISDNTVGTAGTTNSGGFGIKVAQNGAGTLGATISNNSLYQYQDTFGLYIRAVDGSGVLNTSVTNNTFNTPANANPYSGLGIEAGAIIGDSGTVCASINNNNILASGNPADYTIGTFSNAKVKLSGYGGAANDNAAITTFIKNNNVGDPVVDLLFNDNIIEGVMSCP